MSSSSPQPSPTHRTPQRPVRWAIPALCALMVLILGGLTALVVHQVNTLPNVPEPPEPLPSNSATTPKMSESRDEAGIPNVLAEISRVTPGGIPGAGDRPDDPMAKAALEKMQEYVAQAVEVGKAQEIIPQVQQLVQQYPRYAPARTMLGQLLLDAGQAEQALSQFQVGLELDANQPELHLLTGMVAQKLNRDDLAQSQYQTAIELAPQQVRYRLHLAQLHLQRKDYDSARDLLLRTIQMDSSAHKAYAMLAEVFAQQNRLTLAIEQAHKAIEHTPIAQKDIRLGYVRQKATLLRRDNRPDEALQVLGNLPADQQQTPAVMNDLALCWAMLGKPDRAAAVFEAAIERDPTDYQAALYAAQWQLKAGQIDLARRHWNLMRSLKPRDPLVEQIRKQLDASPTTAPAPGIPAPGIPGPGIPAPGIPAPGIPGPGSQPH